MIKTREIKIVMQDGYEQYRITLPREWCRKLNILKGDVMLLLNKKDASPFLVAIPKSYYNNKHTRNEIIKFLENFEWVI